MAKNCCAVCPSCQGHMHQCCNERGCRWELNLAKEGEDPIWRTAPHGRRRDEAFWYCLFCDTKLPMTAAQVKTVAESRAAIDERLIKANELPTLVPHE